MEPKAAFLELSKEKRQQIEEITQKTLIALGCDACNFDDISRETHISKEELASYFASMEDLRVLTS